MGYFPRLDAPVVIVLSFYAKRDDAFSNGIESMVMPEAHIFPRQNFCPALTNQNRTRSGDFSGVEFYPQIFRV